MLVTDPEVTIELAGVLDWIAEETPRSKSCTEMYWSKVECGGALPKKNQTMCQ